MAGRSSRVQARAWKHNEAHRRQKETLKNLEVNANFYKVLEGAAGGPPSRPSRGHLQSGRSGWKYEQIWTGKWSGDFRAQPIMRDKWVYQYQKGVDQVVIGRRTYGPGRVDATVEWKGEEDWRRKINAAYWSGQGMQDDIAKQRARLEGWKAFDPSTVGSSRGRGGSRLGTSSSVVSVGGGYASGSAVAGNVTGNVGQIADRIKSEGLVLGTDSSGKGVYVKASATEESKAKGVLTARKDSSLKKSSGQMRKVAVKDEKTGIVTYNEFEQTGSFTNVMDDSGNYMQWGQVEKLGRRNKMEQSKAKDAEMKAKGIKGSASLYKAEPFISAFERDMGYATENVSAKDVNRYFDTRLGELEKREEQLTDTSGAVNMWKDGKFVGSVATTAIRKAELDSIQDQKIGVDLARTMFLSQDEVRARADAINKSAKLQAETKEGLKVYMGKGASYLNPEQYSEKLEEYESGERNVKALIGSSYRELLYGRDIRVDISQLEKYDAGRGGMGLRQVDKVKKTDLTAPEQVFAIDDRRDSSGRRIVYSAKQLEGIRKSRQRGEPKYEIPDMPETRDPRLQRSRFRKIVRYTRQELPRYREEYKAKELQLEQLRSEEKVSDVQYQAYLKQIQSKTKESVDIYRKTGGSTVKFDDTFGSELRQFGTKRKQLQLDIAVAETETDALKKNIEATDAELERLKKLKTKMGGEGVGGGGRMVNPARIKIAQAKRGYGSAIMSQGERSARRRSGLSGGGRKARRQARLEARGLVVGETEGRRPDKNKFAFDVLRSLERERRRILGQ